MIIGHQKQWQYLVKSAERNNLPHAFLFSGQEKLGKKTLSLEFTKHLFKEDVTKRQHPDFVFITPLKKEIQISQIKECIWKLSLKPSVAPYKIAVIDEAHCLNQEAQNSLLKTLEEPKGKTALFLITEYPERLFPTIPSRCQNLKFYPVPKEEIKSYLQGQKIPAAQIEEIINNSAGRPGLVMDFLSDPQKLKTQKAAVSDLLRLMNSDLSFRFQRAKNLAAEPEGLKETLDIWLAYFRKIFLNKCLTSDVKQTDKLKNIINLTQKTNFLISTTNVNPRLALEILMMEF